MCLRSIITLIVLLPGWLPAQKIIGIGTRYVDTFREWVISTEEDDLKGEMRMRWAFRDDWTEWDVQIGDISATIEQKWKDDPNLWEVRCEGIVVNVKTTWPGEFHRWKLHDGKHHFNWGTKYFNQRSEWFTDAKNPEFFQVYMYWDGDPREWVVVDELPGDVSMAMKIAMIFLAVHFSSPRI